MNSMIDPQHGLFDYVDLEQRVPEDHPIRDIRHVVDKALKALQRDFSVMDLRTGRSSIAPEMLLRAQFLQILYSIRFERQLMERLDYDLLFRWFVGLEFHDPVWNHLVFADNRDRVLTAQIAQRLFDEIAKQADARRLMSWDHFSVDSTLVEATAAMQLFVTKRVRKSEDDGAGSPDRLQVVDLKVQKYSDNTRCFTTGPIAQ